MPRPGDFALSRSQVEKDYADAKATELMQEAAGNSRKPRARRAAWRRPQKEWD